ncbi:MAG: hypothetical protein NPIRA06_15960 [Nitrospirales bacterium]|nr:MAG: hypothetical protein NPIRA06_15960 [Nitrospirales bacterium]
MLNMQSDLSGQDQHFKIAALGNEVLHGIPMTDRDPILLYDGSSSNSGVA